MSDEEEKAPEPQNLQIPEHHLQRVVEHHFQKKLGRKTPICWMCQTTNWTIAGVYVLYPFLRPKHVLGSTVAPLVMLRCTKCSQTFFLPWPILEKAWKEENPDAD